MIGSPTPAALPLDAKAGSPPLPPVFPGAPRRAPRATPAPIAITYPHSLHARFEAMPSEDIDMTDPDVETFSLLEGRDLPPHSEAAMSDAEALAAGLPFDPDTSNLKPQAHMQALLLDFRRRQRQAGLIVAGSIAAATVLTVAGIVMVTSLATPRQEQTVPSHSTSVAWQPPQTAPALIAAQQIANRRNKGEPLLLRAHAGADGVNGAWLRDAALRADAPSIPASVILVQTGRPLALAPLLPQRQARYLLLRGLPDEARLSAGERKASGAWIVKDGELPDLTLIVNKAANGGGASGDYPVDVYLLGTSKTAQSRQRLLLRVEPAAGAFPSTSLRQDWPAALLDLALMSLDPGIKAAAAVPSPLLARARAALGEGDIAGARLLLLHLAEQGEAEAAYELAQSYDPQVLTGLGARGMGGDPTRARGWYEQASESGNEDAKERLKILASLAD
jgi:TPR repeat protein